MSRYRILLAVAVGAVLVGLAIVLYGGPFTEESSPAASGPDAHAPRQAIESDGKRSSGKSTQDVDPMAALAAKLDPVVGDTAKLLHPLEWTRAEFDGKPKYFSPEDLARAKAIVKRYRDNFQSIESLEFDFKVTETVLKDTKRAREWARVRGADLHFKLKRQPMSLKMTGTRSGQKVTSIVTPVGRTGDGSKDESFLPFFLDGDFAFTDYVLLTYGNRVREGVHLAEAPKALREQMSKMGLADELYNVIEKPGEKRGVRTVNSHWFNDRTGMLDFLVLRPEPDDGSGSFAVFEYYDLGSGRYYLKRELGRALDGEIQEENRITNLVVNGETVG